MRTAPWYLICLGAAMVSLLTAMAVIAFGAIASSGVYGSRMAWLLGVAAPLLVLVVLLTWLPSRRHVVALPAAAAPSAVRTGRVVLASAAVLLGAPALLAAILLTTYGVFFVVHGISQVV